MQVQVVDTKGKSIGKLNLPDEIYAVAADRMLLAQAARVYLANRRQGNAKVKSRGEVRGSGKKIWRQKGTGRARHGDRYAPIFVGGGVAHGPRGNQHVKRKMSRAMRRKALFASLSLKVKTGKLLVVDGLEKLSPKTKVMSQAIEAITKGERENLAIILSQNADLVKRSARNLSGVSLLSATKLNAYEILDTQTILMMKDAAKTIEETFLTKRSIKQEAPPPKQKREIKEKKAKTKPKIVTGKTKEKNK